VIDRKSLIVFGRISAAMLGFQAMASAQFAAAPASPAPAVPSPCCVVVGDFNEDGIPDIAVLSATANTLTILLGIGNGALQPGTSMPISNSPRSMAAADFTGDGHLDLIIATNPPSGPNVIWLTGNGKGMFTQQSTYSAGQIPSFVLAADFNNDGFPDFAVSDQVGNAVYVFLNNGTGGFLNPAKVPVGQGPSSIASVRLNGTTYMAVANRGEGTVTLLSYTSSGFQPVMGSPFAVFVPNPSNLTPAPASVVLADFNGDGLPDIASADQGTNTISVLLSNNQGGYTPVPNGGYSAGAGPIYLVTSDFNNDGWLDLAAVNGTDSTLTLLLGSAQGTFTNAGTQPSPGPQPFGMAVGDFLRNGQMDLAIADNGGNTVTVLLNNYPAALTMVSAASYQQPVAPGSIVSIYGTSLASTTASASSATPGLPVALGGATVTLTDSTGASNPLSLFYVSPSQINALVPATAAPGRARLELYTGSTTLLGGVTVASASPGLFSANQSGQGVAWAQFVNNIYQISDVFQCPGGSAVSGPCSPVPLNVSPANCPSGGCSLVLYGTGLHNPPADSVYVMIGGQKIQAAYAGPSQYPGEDQVNVTLSPSLAGSGAVSVRLLAPGGPSNIVTVYIQ